jgi:hypothetical protein
MQTSAESPSGNILSLPGVYSGMACRVRWGLIVRIVVIAALAPIVCLAAYVPIQQHILRWRAERLLADIRQIQMGKSTWADAQRLMHRWGQWGRYQNECNQQYCSYEISIDDISHAYRHFPFLDGGQWESQLRWPIWINRPFVWAGGRFAVVRASFEVRNGAIWAKSFAARTAFSPKAYDRKSDAYAAPDSNVVADGFCTTSLALGRFPGVVFSIENPEVSLSLTDNDRDGHWVVAAFTPFAAHGTVDELLEFNLSCITSMKECRTAAELMPNAVSIYKAGHREAIKAANANYLKYLPIWVAARDAGYVVIAEVIGITQRQPTDRPTLSFEVIKLLKGYALISNHTSFYMLNTVGSRGICSISSSEARDFRNGAKVLVILDEPLNEQSTPNSDASACIVLPLRDENLAASEKGIARYSVLYPSTWGF